MLINVRWSLDLDTQIKITDDVPHLLKCAETRPVFLPSHAHDVLIDVKALLYNWKLNIGWVESRVCLSADGGPLTVWWQLMSAALVPCTRPERWVEETPTKMWFSLLMVDLEASMPWKHTQMSPSCTYTGQGHLLQIKDGSIGPSNHTCELSSRVAISMNTDESWWHVSVQDEILIYGGIPGFLISAMSRMRRGRMLISNDDSAHLC